MHAELDGLAQAYAQLERDRRAAQEHLEHLEALVEALRGEGRARSAELDALREQMRAAVVEGSGRLARLVACRLARRLQSWDAQLEGSADAAAAESAAESEEDEA